MADEVKDVNETVEATPATEATATEAKAAKKAPSVDVEKIKSGATNILGKVKDFFTADKKKAKMVIMGLIAFLFVCGLLVDGVGYFLIGGLITAVALYGAWVGIEVPEVAEATEEKPAE